MAKKLQRSVQRTGASGRGPAGGAKGRSESDRPKRGLFSRRVSAQAVTEFTLQLGTLIEAGIPVVRALKVLEGQTPPGPLKEIIGELVDDVSAGTPLSEAMGKHPEAFDDLFSAMVRAGEMGGVLDAVLARIGGFRERSAELRGKVGGAMIYPTIVLGVSILVVAVVIYFVVPKFEEVFASFGTDLPAATRLLLTISRGAVEYWYLVFGLPSVLFVLHLFGMRRLAYRRRVHGALLRLPLLGGVLTLAVEAAFARTFGTLIQAGVPHIESLEITRDTTGNEVVCDAVEEVRRVVREGEPIARPMAASEVFDDLVVSMVEVGEQTGELDRMLLKIADAYDARVERSTGAFFKVLEPALLVLIALIVGGVVIALFLPMLGLMDAVGAG